LCGIAGFTHLEGEVDPARLQNAVRSLIHRGPDQQGVFQSKTVSLGVRRLRIIDLPGGDQPIFDANHNTVIVFNGEIYNHLELRRELEQRGRGFHSRSDTETVLQAFLEWDTGCFSRFRGMFSVALWTESTRRLILARDRMGIKPLYVARRGADIYFGSEMKTLFVHPEIERSLSLSGLDCFLSLNYVPAPHSLVEGVEKLRPGHWLEWRNGAIRNECYWQLPFRRGVRCDLQSATQEIDRLLKESVAEHLVTDVPLGLWLSGGIDSSTLLHYAAEASSSRIKTFSISFRGRSFDETRYIRQVTNRYGTEHYEFDLNADQDLPAAISEFAYYADEPNGDAGALPVWFLSRLSRRHVTVALSGEGADELFGGYLTYRASLLARVLRRLPPKLLDVASTAADWLPVSNEKISFEYMVKRFLNGCRMAPAQGHVYWNGTFGPDEKGTLIQRPLDGTLNSILDELRSAGDDLAAYLWFDRKYFLPDDILAKVDRISMAHALEVRPPFLDHRIVEFAAGLPDDLLIRGSRQKVILKELMKNRLPPAILSHKKIGFDIPAHEWFRGPLRPLLEEALEIARERSDFFRIEIIEQMVRAHMERRLNVGYHLWGLMTLFLWMKKWRIRTIPPARQARSAMANVLRSI
jgi:asparagine synthase (glutamine-hydrolysing)